MASGDRKFRWSGGRSSGWTKSDQRRYARQQLRDNVAAEKARIDRHIMMARMTETQRREFLAEEKAEVDRKARERLLANQDLERRRKIAREEYDERLQSLINDARLLAGHIRSDIATVVSQRERYDLDDGDWLDNPVSALTEGVGFGEVYSAKSGVKLQINLALDISNSMYYNGLALAAVESFRTLYWALDIASKELPDDALKLTAWLWAGGRDGKRVTQLYSDSARVRNDILGAMAALPASDSVSGWTGEDTWIFPLLKELEKADDDDNVRLDIVITDGVLEHATDSRKGDVIQERRNGNLQTVVLNFVPMDEWGDYGLPNRCIQYEVRSDNLLFVMQQAVADWLNTI